MTAVGRSLLPLPNSDNLQDRFLRVLFGLSLEAAITPPQLTASVNDYNPQNLEVAAVLRLSSNGAVNVTGLRGGNRAGRALFVVNVGSNNITLKNASASSRKQNRFALNGDLTLGAQQTAILWYDQSIQNWVSFGAGILPVVPLTVPYGGTGVATTTAYGLITGGTTATGVFQNAGTGTSAQIPISQGAAALLNWCTMSGDATLSATGALTVANNAITNAKLAGSITPDKFDPSIDIGRNYAHNPTGLVAQRAAATIANNTQAYGKCDRWKLAVAATTVTAGTFDQYNATNPRFNTDYGIWINGLSTTGSTTVYFRQFLEAKDCQGLINQTGSLYFNFYQDTGSSQTVTIKLYSAANEAFQSTGAPTYGTMTQIGSTQNISGMTTGTVIGVAWDGVSLGSAVTGGVMIEVSMAVSAVTNKNFILSDVEFQISPVHRNSRVRTYQEELAICQRYCYSISGDSNSSFICSGTTATTSAGTFILRYPVTMRARPAFSQAPSGTFHYHLQNGSAGNDSAVTAISYLGNSAVDAAGLSITGTGTPYTANQPAQFYFSGASSTDKLIFDADF